MFDMDFIFSINSNSSIDSFIIMEDGVCELDEIFAAEIVFGAIEGFEVRAREPITTFIIIKDVDGGCQELYFMQYYYNNIIIYKLTQI